MDNIENIKEEVTGNIESTTIEIPIRVTMTSYDEAPFEFITSIDEVGQIILVPVDKAVEFINVNTDSNLEQDVPVREQETITTVEGNVTTRETSLLIKADMLCENDNHEVSAVVDDIGQVVIYPVAKENVFVTASFEESLNLVTEDISTTIDYFGYTLVNSGDGWDVYDNDKELVDEGVATLPEAKILVCSTEISKLKSLTEEITEEQSESSEINAEEDAPEQPEVTAEVIDESAELTDEEKRQQLLTRFLQGDIALFSDTGIPAESYMHISELDSNGYTYYYDEETDAIVSYPSVV